MSGSVNAPPAVDLPTLLPGALRAAGTPRGGLGGWAGGGTAGVDRRSRRTLRDWIVDVLIFVLSLSLGILLLFGQESTGHPTPRWLLVADVVFGTVACLALWWRRRWPVAIALALTPVGAFSSLSGFAVMAMVFTVAVHRRARVALLVAAANIATVPVYSVVRPSNDLFWLNLLISALATAVVLGWGMFARARRQLLLSLQDRALRAEAEQQLRVDQARQLERTRIAREMHDVLAHRISLLSVHAGALEFRTDASHEQVAAAAGVIRANAHQALQELREVIGVLREDVVPGSGSPDPTAALPLPATAPEPPQPGIGEIPALIAESTGAGSRVAYRCELTTTDDVPRSVARTAYRVVQEGLTNARKHAPGAAITVTLDGDPGHEIAVEIVNPIPSWPPTTTVPGAGLGLVGLGERVQLTGGRLAHGRDRDGRFVLRAELPCRR